VFFLSSTGRYSADIGVSVSTLSSINVEYSPFLPIVRYTVLSYK
jgi:hypothetical protein